jgi:glycosyltransferase involved in cell wall biosynthesis
VLTGFLSERTYVDLLFTADVIVDLTTFDHCLVCGAYEALAAGKAFVLSDKQANRELFGDVPIYVEPTTDAIGNGLRRILAELPERTAVTQQFRGRFTALWRDRFLDLQSRLRRLLEAEGVG